MPRRALSRWMIPLYSLLALALVPWVLWLAWTLPASSVTSHYRLAWVGFDVLLAGSMARTAYLAWRRSPFVVNVASATATLLVVDAWFDVTTSPGGDELVRSALLAVFVELPLAVLSLVLAGRAQIEIAAPARSRRAPACCSGSRPSRSATRSRTPSARGGPTRRCQRHRPRRGATADGHGGPLARGPEDARHRDADQRDGADAPVGHDVRGAPALTAGCSWAGGGTTPKSGPPISLEQSTALWWRADRSAE